MAALQWPIVLLANIGITYIPHLFLRIPAVNSKLAADAAAAKKSGAEYKGLKR